MEIERRWLMDGFLPEGAPGVQPLCEIEKAQGYLCCAPVVRIRSEYTPAEQKREYILCVKGKGGMVRTEIETPLSAETFEELRQFIGVPLITKRTRVYRLADGYELECSLVDEGQPTAFYYAEVEFKTRQEAESWAAPAFLGEEKTGDPVFSMSRYWQKKCLLYQAAQPCGSD